MISGTTLACLLTAVVGCYIFVHLASKEMEISEMDRRIRRWTEDREAHREANAQQPPLSVTSKGIEPVPSLTPPDGQPEADEQS